jgi:hypothetical protein
MAHGIQASITTQPAVSVVGDFCDANPRYTYQFGPNGAVAGPSGLTIGQFCWAAYSTIDGDNSPAALNNFGSGAVTGFVGRNQQGLITTYLANSGLVIPAGFEAVVYSAGGFWVKNSGTTQAVPGQKAYANYANGTASFAATGSPSTASGSASSIAAETSSFTGSITNNVLTVTGTVTGTIYPGTTISGTNVASGTMITGQLSGTTGGDGTYSVTPTEQTVASTTISGTYGLLTVGGTVAGTFGLGQTLSGANVVAGTAITALVSGTGGAGTYVVNNNTVVSSTAITAATNIETSWYARSFGAAGELVKISNVPGVG